MTTVSVLTSVSLLLNVAVLVPVVVAMIANAAWVRRYFGDRTPARDVLLSLYIAILAASGVLLFLRTPAAVLALLGIQVLYKVITVVTVRHSLRNPVVLSNLGIAVLHVITISVIGVSIA